MSTVFAIFAAASFFHTLGAFLDHSGHLSRGVSGWWRFSAQLTFGSFFVVAGLAHFDAKLSKRLYLPMLEFCPKSLRSSLNFAAGVVEVGVGAWVLGAALLSKQGVASAATAAICVLGAVFPANIYVAVSPAAQSATGQTQTFAVIRLLIQVTFCVWAGWPLLVAR
jgi:uncharacterized membrane protein